MSEAEKRLHRCCFTGHRPNKLGMSEESIQEWLRKEIEKAIDDGYCTFLSGMCWGVDIIAAELVLKERRKNPNIHLIAAIPHPDFEVRWREDWQQRYHRILHEADLTRTVCDKRSVHKPNDSYQIRNEWMVNHSKRIICIYNGAPGGTRNTIEYALRMNLEIINIDDKAISRLKGRR